MAFHITFNSNLNDDIEPNKISFILLKYANPQDSYC
jgi:hypothetical protein